MIKVGQGIQNLEKYPEIAKDEKLKKLVELCGTLKDLQKKAKRLLSEDLLRVQEKLSKKISYVEKSFQWCEEESTVIKKADKAGIRLVSKVEKVKNCENDFEKECNFFSAESRPSHILEGLENLSESVPNLQMLDNDPLNESNEFPEGVSSFKQFYSDPFLIYRSWMKTEDEKIAIRKNRIRKKMEEKLMDNLKQSENRIEKKDVKKMSLIRDKIAYSGKRKHFPKRGLAKYPKKKLPEPRDEYMAIRKISNPSIVDELRDSYQVESNHERMESAHERIETPRREISMEIEYNAEEFEKFENSSIPAPPKLDLKGEKSIFREREGNEIDLLLAIQTKNFSLNHAETKNCVSDRSELMNDIRGFKFENIKRPRFEPREDWEDVARERGGKSYMVHEMLQKTLRRIQSVQLDDDDRGSDEEW